MIRVTSLHTRTDHFVLSDISFTVATGSYAVLMGRSGCGKTTILESICGLRAIASGTIRLDSRDVTALPPADRRIGYVPQDLALFPHLSVRENLAFALRVREPQYSDRIEEIQSVDERIEELGELLGISDLFGRTTGGLSGGEAQRVALGRALAFRPTVLLLDEPLSALDEESRDEMHAVLRTVRQKARVTALHVTHHRDDAKALADVVFELRGGKVKPVS